MTLFWPPASLAGFVYGGVALFLWCIYRRAFVSTATVFLGRISYSLYLFHGVFLILMDKHFISQAAPFYARVAVFGVSIVTATIVYYCVEKPAIKSGRILCDRKYS